MMDTMMIVWTVVGDGSNRTWRSAIPQYSSGGWYCTRVVVVTRRRLPGTAAAACAVVGVLYVWMDGFIDQNANQRTIHSFGEDQPVVDTDTS